MTAQRQMKLLMDCGYLTGVLLSIEPGEIAELVQDSRLQSYNRDLILMIEDLRLIARERLRGSKPMTGDSNARNH